MPYWWLFMCYCLIDKRLFRYTYRYYNAVIHSDYIDMADIGDKTPPFLILFSCINYIVMYNCIEQHTYRYYSTERVCSLSPIVKE